mgnify:FL=1
MAIYIYIEEIGNRIVGIDLRVLDREHGDNAGEKELCDNVAGVE